MDELKKSLKERHLKGQKKYGTFSFLGKDMKEEAKEELIDAVNYSIYEELKGIKVIESAELPEGDFNELHSRIVEGLTPRAVKEMLLSLIKDLCL